MLSPARPRAPRNGTRVGTTAPALLSTLLLLGGCQTLRPDPGAERSVRAAVGLGDPVVFRSEGGPLDEPAGAASLSIAEAVRRAVTTDPDLQAALARVRIAMADADQARLLPNPILSIALRWGPGKPQIEASLAQDFIEALRIPRRSSAADNRMRQAAAEAVTVALDLVAQVQERYVAGQATDQLLPLLHARSEVLARLTEVSRSRLSAGEGVRGDVTTLDALRVELEVEIADANQQRREDRLRLARLIGEPSSAADWTLEAWTPASMESQGQGRWIEAAMLHRPELQAACWQLAALGDDAALVSLLAWEGASAGVDVSRDDQWFAGPSVLSPLPVFDTGQARRARVSGEQIEARHTLVAARRRIVEEVRVAHEALNATIQILRRVREELIPIQIERRRQAEEAYRAGITTDLTSLLLAEQDLRAAEARAVDLERRAMLARIQLERAVGGPPAAVSARASHDGGAGVPEGVPSGGADGPPAPSSPSPPSVTPSPSATNP